MKTHCILIIGTILAVSGCGKNDKPQPAAAGKPAKAGDPGGNTVSKAPEQPRTVHAPPPDRHEADFGPDKNLTNDDIGNDPSAQTNYNRDRIDDVSIPAVAAKDKGVQPEDVPGVSFGRVGTPGDGPEPFGTGGRSGSSRQRLLREGGGNVHSEAAVAGGLKWLSIHQSADGKFSLDKFAAAGGQGCKCDGPGKVNDMAGTGLALLAFLGCGETHRGAGRPGRAYTKVVERGLKWLITMQSADGQLGEGYAHGINAIVLCEAYGMTADPWLKAPAQRAVNCTVAWQAKDGGFRYQPRQAGDTSVTGWHVQALMSAQLAGLSVPRHTWAGVDQWLATVGDQDQSKFGYNADNKKPAPGPTAIGLLCRLYRGVGRHTAGQVKGMAFLSENYSPKWNKAGDHFEMRNIYYYYYATQVVHQMGGPTWDKWNPKMRDMLIKMQDKSSTHKKGSWWPVDAKPADTWPQLGRLGYTSLAVLTLEVYYRHTPPWRPKLGSDKDE